MNAVMKHLKPYLESGEVKRKGHSSSAPWPATCTISARTLVSMIINGGGYEVIDLGIDVPPTNISTPSPNLQAALSACPRC
jgi:5-methyltetrahydrofolate--homocysteine methyltransferase